MLPLLILIVVGCSTAMLLGWSRRGPRWLALAGAAALLYMASTIAWWWMLYFQIVSFDPLLARLGIFRTEGWIGFAIFFLPPFLPVAVLLLQSARRSPVRKH